MSQKKAGIFEQAIFRLGNIATDHNLHCLGQDAAELRAAIRYLKAGERADPSAIQVALANARRVAARRKA
jgi:hypothetical protein